MSDPQYGESDQRPYNEPQRQPGSVPPPSPPPGAGGTGWSGSSGQQPAARPWQARPGEQGPAPAPPGGPAMPPPYASDHPGTAGAGAQDTTVLSASPEAGPAPKKGRGRMLLAGLAIGAIVGGGSGAAVFAWLDDDGASDGAPVESSLVEDEGSDDTPTNQNAAALDSVESVADQVLPSVVSITVAGQMGEGTGTGVVISSDGEILTNNHVVAPAGQGGALQVTFNDGASAQAEVVGTDPMTDLAVIQARDVSDLTPASLGSSSDLSVGEQVVAIGSPLGLDGTVTSGIISALQRPIVTGQNQSSQTFVDAIQTDAPINRGNSGGPLVNMSGEVVGINSAIATSGMESGSIGLGFSIPIDQARPIAEELSETGTATHAMIGIEVGTPQEGDTQGALIGAVTSGSGAEEAGLQEGDIITKLDDRAITDHVTLIAAARSYRPGDEVTLTYVRDGEEHQVEVTLGSDAQTT